MKHFELANLNFEIVEEILVMSNVGLVCNSPITSRGKRGFYINIVPFSNCMNE